MRDRRLAITGYASLFGVMIALGPYGLDGRSSYGHLAPIVYSMWVALALVGTVMIGLKDWRLPPGTTRRVVTVLDVVGAIFGIVVLAVVPDSLLVARTNILAVVLLGYVILLIVWMHRARIT